MIVKVRGVSLSYSHALTGGKLPLDVSVQGSDVDPSGDIDALGEVVDVLQRPLDAVEDGAHDAGAQLHREGLPRAQDRVSHGYTRCGTRFRRDNKRPQLDNDPHLDTGSQPDTDQHLHTE